MTDLLEAFSQLLIYDLLGITHGSTLGSVLSFFVYDSIKILLMLFVMIFIMGIARTYLSKKKIRDLLSHRIPVIPNIVASIFGAITPFCSCSSIPIFMGFIEAGVPLGVAFSFLATSPLVNEYAFVVLFGFFGFEVAVAYLISGIILGVVIGLLVKDRGLEQYLVQDIFTDKKKKEAKFASFKERIVFGYLEASSIVSKLWVWILLGVAIGAGIHGFIPDDVVHSFVSSGGIFSVPIAVLIGIPVYANCAAVLPIAFVLFEKGVPLGTALAFVMAASALSLPEAIILRRIMKLKLLILFFGLVAIGILLIGYLFNFLF